MGCACCVTVTERECFGHSSPWPKRVRITGIYCEPLYITIISSSLLRLPHFRIQAVLRHISYQTVNRCAESCSHIQRSEQTLAVRHPDRRKQDSTVWALHMIYAIGRGKLRGSIQNVILYSSPSAKPSLNPWFNGEIILQKHSNTWKLYLLIHPFARR